MAKKQKPIKIKRYKDSMKSSKSYARKAFLQKAVAVMLVMALLVSLTSFAYFIVLPYVTSFLNDSNNDVIPTPTVPPISDSAVNSEELQIDTTPAPLLVQDKVYYTASVYDFQTEETILNLIDTLKQKNVTHCAVYLKDENGNVNYESENEFAKLAQSVTIIDIENAIAMLNENDIEFTAIISAFKDDLYSINNRPSAIFYGDTDARWLDNALTAGGKGWINPSNEEGQNYIKDLVNEVIDFGVSDIIIADYQIPQYGVLDQMNFFVSDDELKTQMQSFAKELQQTANVNNTNLSFIIDYQSFKLGDYAHYTQNPLEMLSGNIIFKASIESLALQEDLVYIADLKERYNLTSTGILINDIAQGYIIENIDNYFIK